jgi:hypothetical protein
LQRIVNSCGLSHFSDGGKTVTTLKILELPGKSSVVLWL